MSALAQYFHLQGCHVAGYDRTPSRITDSLRDLGIQVHFEQELSGAPEFLWTQPDHTLVIYTPAVPESHPVLAHVKKEGYPVKKRSTIIGELSEEFFTIAVGGAHGKTSTSALIAHALKVAGIPFYGFLGGIAANYQTNFLAPADSQQAELILTEADEYDRSFLKLCPDICILTSTDADHLDIYETAEALYQAYQQFAGQTKPNGRLVFPVGFHLPQLEGGVTNLSFGIEQGTFQARKIHIRDHHYHFTLSYESGAYTIETPVPGKHNVLNATAAAAGLHNLMNCDTFQRALKTFKGVYRRLEWVVKSGSQVLVDDYAHHPNELTYAIQTLKELYPESRITGIFQPHLYSRTRDFAAGFAEALSYLDRVLLLPIYPAREEPIPGVSSNLIYQLLNHNDKALLNKTELLEFIRKDNYKVIVTLGAGDISDIVPQLAEIIQDKDQT